MRDRFTHIAHGAAILGGLVGVFGMLTLNLIPFLFGLGVFLAAIAFIDRDTRMNRE